MLELDSLVDGVTAPTNGTPESAAAIRAASEGTAGVRDDGGGLGGGGAGAASFAVGEQLQNMLGVWSLGYGVRGGGLPQRRVQTRGEVCGESFFTPAQLAGSVVRPIERRKSRGFKMEEVA